MNPLVSEPNTQANNPKINEIMARPRIRRRLSATSWAVDGERFEEVKAERRLGEPIQKPRIVSPHINCWETTKLLIEIPTSRRKYPKENAITGGINRISNLITAPYHVLAMG